MSIRDFEIVSKLGEGVFSSVYKVIRHEDKKIYALKRVKILSLSQKQKQNALNQIRILASITHNHVIGYKQAFMDDNTKSLCIVMEFANNGDLAYRITEKQKKRQCFQEDDIWKLFIQIVLGLNQLHKRNIFHRDIKSANIFLNKTDEAISAKLGDMNVSKITQKGLCITQTGTPYYASPQVWKDRPYDSKSDIWSLGCVLYEMITLKPPFRAEDMQGLYKKVVKGIYPRIPSQFSKQLTAMIRCLLQVNPQMRPSCQKILKMSSVQRRIKSIASFTNLNESNSKKQLLRTIRVGESFHNLTQLLPKASYLDLKKGQRSIKNMSLSVEAYEQLNSVMCEIESLPFLQRQKRINISDRKCGYDKISMHLISKQQKSVQKMERQENEIKQLKLPKVKNRYQGGKNIRQKINKRRSVHKI